MISVDQMSCTQGFVSWDLQDQNSSITCSSCMSSGPFWSPRLQNDWCMASCWQNHRQGDHDAQVQQAHTSRWFGTRMSRLISIRTHFESILFWTKFSRLWSDCLHPAAKKFQSSAYQHVSSWLPLWISEQAQYILRATRMGFGSGASPVEGTEQLGHL